MMRVFVNGCFDVLHVGHVRLLNFAQMFGEVSVGVNDDHSVSRLKGDGRPINTLVKRVELLDSLVQVSRIFVFGEDDPVALLARMYQHGVGPDFVVKGPEYDGVDIPERGVVEKNGGRFMIFHSVVDDSTTNVIRSIRGVH